MKKIVFGLLVFVLLIPGVFGQEIEFEHVWRGYLHFTDQHPMLNLTVDDDDLYVLMKYESFHREIEEVNFSRYDISSPNEWEDCQQRQNCIPQFCNPGQSWRCGWNISYLPQYKPIDPKLKLTNAIHVIDETIFLPDNSGSAYVFNKELNYLDHISDFHLPELSNKSIIVNNQKAYFPINLFNHIYIDALILDTTIVLFSDTKYTVIGKDELSQLGPDARHTTYDRPLTQNGYNRYDFIPLGGDYFVLFDGKAASNAIIQTFRTGKAKAFSYVPLSKYETLIKETENTPRDNSVYTLEHSGLSYYIHKYAIHGLEPKSAVDSGWEMYE
ncbi:MAG: hypothetical protein P9L94_06245 [Candidatus Hinthialibacter antarcticus]|nr:hypothetical protein [Candidatus Hinthialibacter antarcticus]